MFLLVQCHCVTAAVVTLYEQVRIEFASTQFMDLAGRPQYLVGAHRWLPELIWLRGVGLTLMAFFQSCGSRPNE